MTLPARARARPRTTRPTPYLASTTGWFRAVWRWHFFASFLVVPILLLLATTGLIYLFRFQLEPLLHPDLMKVDAPARAGVAQPYISQLAVVEQAYPARPRSRWPSRATTDSPTIFSITTAGRRRAATCSSTPTSSRCWARSTRTRRSPAARSGCTAS